MPTPSTGLPPERSPEPVASRLGLRRSPRLVAVGVLLTCLGGLGGAVAYQQAAHANQVVVVQRDLPRGAVVRQTDLAVVTIGSAPGISTIAPEEIGELIGRRALVDLPAHSLVGRGAIGTPTLPKGHAQVGLKLAAGRVPAEELPAGTPVQLVEVGSDKHESSSLVVDAKVLGRAQQLPDGSSQVIDVAVPKAQSARIADLAARDLLVVVRLAGG